jgi:hypothetical protein
MGTVHFKAATDKTFAQFQTDLHKALSESFAAAAMSYRWEGQTLRASAPGSTADVWLDIRTARVRLEMWFPATMMRDRIIRDVVIMLEKASGGRAEMF